LTDLLESRVTYFSMPRDISGVRTVSFDASMKRVGISIVVLLSLEFVRMPSDASSFTTREPTSTRPRNSPYAFGTSSLDPKSVTFTSLNSYYGTYMDHASHCGNTPGHTNPFPVLGYQYTRKEQLLRGVGMTTYTV
jgi:hypothetical protein